MNERERDECSRDHGSLDAHLVHEAVTDGSIADVVVVLREHDEAIAIGVRYRGATPTT